MDTLTPHQKAVYNGEKCPYCRSVVRTATQKEVYGKEYSKRPMIVCDRFPICDSYVGTHDDGTPLGRLANKELREAKMNAHTAFDKLWQEGFLDRNEAYEELSDFLEIDKEYTHIGMFNINTCKKVLFWSDSMYNKLKSE